MEDDWLARWLPLVAQRARGAPVLELGCGDGRDTAALEAAGQAVVAVDLSDDALAMARRRAPRATFVRGDLREPLPVPDAGTGVAIASLSLHYFAWRETEAVVERIRTVLRPSGVLLCRVNSTEDHHHGASGHPALDERYYLVDGQPKRFFARDDVERLFARGWRALSVEHCEIRRYALPKRVWEAVLERVD